MSYTITSLDIAIAEERRAIREQNLDLIFARIARQHAAKQAATTAPIAAPSKPTPARLIRRPAPLPAAPTLSDEAFERVRRAVALRAERQDENAAAEAILAAFWTFEPGTSDDRPPPGPASPDGDAAVAAIMTAFRTFSLLT